MATWDFLVFYNSDGTIRVTFFTHVTVPIHGREVKCYSVYKSTQISITTPLYNFFINKYID